jgi:hypothetical protein
MSYLRRPPEAGAGKQVSKIYIYVTYCFLWIPVGVYPFGFLLPQE